MELRIDDAGIAQAGNEDSARVVEGLVQQGWVVVPGFFGETLVEQLQNEILALQARDELQRAGIGREQEHHRNDLIRRDKTYWLDGSTLAQCRYLELMEQLRLQINRELFLGLFDFEAHFALYESGGFYRKHLDAFQGRSSRIVSVVSYLNPGWQEQHGGCLNIYDPMGNTCVAQVMPEAGTLVCFLSEQIPHEVTLAQRSRCSIAGWFRRNESIGGLVDPAT